MRGPIVPSPAKRPRFTRAADASQKSPLKAMESDDWGSPPRDKSPKYPPPSPPFQGWTPAQMIPEMNRTDYATDEEEFDLNEGFVEPYSIILKTPIKRKRLY